MRRQLSHVPVIWYFGISVLNIMVVLLLKSRSCGMIAVTTREENSNDQFEIFTTSHVCEGNHICSSRRFVTLATVKEWRGETKFITVFVDHSKECKYLPSYVRCLVHECAQPEFEYPIVRCLLQSSMKLARTRTVAFANDDIVFRNITPTITLANSKFSAYVITGRRTNVRTGMVERESGLDDLNNYSKVIASEVTLDYFILRCKASILNSFPAFVIGNWRWDNCLLDFMILENVPAIDASKTMQAFHIGESEDIMQRRPASKYNDRLFIEYRERTKERANKIKRHVCLENNNTFTNSARFGRLSCCPFRTDVFDSVTNELMIY